MNIINTIGQNINELRERAQEIMQNSDKPTRQETYVKAEQRLKVISAQIQRQRDVLAQMLEELQPYQYNTIRIERTLQRLTKVQQSLKIEIEMLSKKL